MRQPSTTRCRGRDTKSGTTGPVEVPLSCSAPQLPNPKPKELRESERSFLLDARKHETIDNAAHPQELKQQAEENENVVLYTKSARACRASNQRASLLVEYGK